MAFCTNCGESLIAGAKFCSNCGAPVNESHRQRKTVYEGELHKCPNCGETLNSFISNCPACGYELRGGTATNSVNELYENIRKAKNNQEISQLIRTFPIPNRKEDIIEFMVLASSNFDEKYYISHHGEDCVSDAWLSKVKQCHQKAQLTLNDTEMKKIDEIAAAIHARISEEKKEFNRQELSRKSEISAREFKKSKFRTVLIVFIVISVLFSAVAFNDSKTLAGFVGVIITFLFITAFLMGNGVIKEKVKNLRLIPAILAFVLFAPFFSLYNSYENTFLFASDRLESIVWKNLILGEHLPDFGYDKAEVVCDTGNALILYFHNTKSSKFKSYVEECKKFGYTIDAEDSGANYTAYNQDGYFLHLHYNDFTDGKELTIDLDDPIKNNQIQWPSSELVKKLPRPKKLIGEVSTETSEAYAIYLTEIEPAYFNEYVTSCMKHGFDIDYSKSETYFRAENKDGISLTVEYKGFNTLYIYIEDYDL